MPDRSPLLALPGAVADGAAAEGAADGATAAHYGDPVAEQRMLAAGRAIVDLSDRGVVTVTGPDRLAWLDSLTSQALATLAPGSSAETLLLDPNGRLEHSIRVIDDGATAWLLVDAAQAAPLAAWLDRMRFMMRVEVADATAAWATLGQLLPEGAEPLVAPAAPNGVPLLWRDPWAALQAGGWQYAAEAEHPGAGFPAVELLVERARLAQVADAVRAGSLVAAGAWALEALRIAAWRPRMSEVDERSIPHELDWLRSAVHLAKGCYRGQETVAKVHNLGHPPRRLVMLHLDGSDALLPAPGAEVRTGDAAVGIVTAAARHHELGPIALAVVKRSLDPSAPLAVAVDDTLIAAAQQVIVPPDAGATANVPRLPRLGAVPRAT
jgi:folate-binding protein YgfZ